LRREPRDRQAGSRAGDPQERTSRHHAILPQNQNRTPALACGPPASTLTVSDSATRARENLMPPPTPTCGPTTNERSPPTLQPAPDPDRRAEVAPLNAAVSNGNDSVTVTALTRSWCTEIHDGPPNTAACQRDAIGTARRASTLIVVSLRFRSLASPLTARCRLK